MNIDLTVLQAFESIRTPALDAFFLLVTQFGEAAILIPALCIIYWCFNKKQAFFLALNFFSALILNHILKITFCIERPWLRWQGEIAPVAKAKITATGYSFPSGHTTTGSAFYTALALTFKKRPVSIFCAVMMVLVGLSRLYLGVHWPIDVFAGLLLGVTVSFVVSRYLNALYDDKQKRIRLSMWIGSLSLVAGAITAILLNLSLIDEVAFTDLMKVFALGGGGYLGFVLENKKVGFIVEEKRSKQILRYLLGLIGILVFMGAKAVIPESLYALGAFLRYTMVGLWATGLYPLIGKNLRLFAGSR